MNCNPTLTADEFKIIHNSLCDLDRIDNDKVRDIVEKMRDALKGAYDQDNDAFNRKHAHYGGVQRELDLDAIWSIYEVKDLNERHTYKNAKTITYKDNWGGDAFSVPINGFTWAALYVAANAAIRDSGDEHHVFIEGFEQVGDTLRLITGS